LFKLHTVYQNVSDHGIEQCFNALYKNIREPQNPVLQLIPHWLTALTNSLEIIIGPIGNKISAPKPPGNNI
jgi:hypothetical protein